MNGYKLEICSKTAIKGGKDAILFLTWETNAISIIGLNRVEVQQYNN